MKDYYNKPNYFQKGHIPHNHKEILGNTYGFFTVIEEPRGSKVLCRCVCGKQKLVNRNNLISRKSTSCGCKGYGVAKSKTVRAWSLMRYRCLTPTSPDFENYGKRGITVCPEWRDDFLSFFKDMGDCPDGYTLDRINVNGDYCKENCRWANRYTQANNRRNTIYLTLNEDTKSLSDWSKITGINRSTITNRIKRGWSEEAALTEPVHKENK